MAITVTAGQRVTAAMLNAFAPLIIIKASDESVISSIVMQNDDDFVVTVAANTTWRGTLCLELAGAEAADFQSDWAVTGTASITARHCYGGAAALTDSSTTTMGWQVRTYTDDVSAGVDASATTRSAYREEIIFAGGASGGTIQFRWSQNVSTASNTTVKGTTSFLDYRRVS